MVKPVYFVLGAIPVIVAILLALPLVTKNEIPVSASNSFDKIEIEYTKHQLKKISNGIAERTGAEKTEIILIKNDGEIKYTVTEKGYPQPDIKSKIDSGILGLGWTHSSYGRTVSNSGVWSEGYISSMLFKKTELTQINTIVLNFEKFLNVKNKPLIVDILINDVYFETLNLKEKEDLNIILKTKKSYFVNGINIIDFKIKNPVTPISKFESVDGRLLGFLIKTLEFK